MATTIREDVSASTSAETAEAKKRSALDLRERAGARELMTEETLRQREESISSKRRQAGPELVPPSGLGQESLRPAGEDAAEAEPTDLETLEVEQP